MNGITARIQDTLSREPDKCLYVVVESHCANCGMPFPIPDYCTRFYRDRALITGAHVRQRRPCDCGGAFVFSLETLIGLGFSESCIVQHEYMERRRRAA